MGDNLKTKISNDYSRGLHVEELFEDLVKKNGFRCYKANSYYNMKEHWDYCLVSDNNINGNDFEYVDVKSKKVNFDEGFIWVELKNVRGDNGWLLSEYTTSIAFETDNSFIFIKRNELQTLVLNRMKQIDAENGDEIIYYLIDNLKPYCRYRRLPNQDIILKVPMVDINDLIFREIFKIL